ncbi:WD40 repeat domain-containing protein [Planktothrix paucivesiculata]|uniref:Uncharacterized protein n=1 Tax=Planktothrix paucivesiculata PCC 9631 TaxID=671071 RepID=A0A7Z9DUF0_9CYAN|nr:WD40 repeat domain-containing protein [Planktothrix paucivesiculata]VXD10914.1 hypothetical protein PL9631_1020009 [Planktothrix paucivesiculata PCC 9631]
MAFICVRAIVFSQDGKFIISGSEDNTIKIWQQVPLPSQTRAI